MVCSVCEDGGYVPDLRPSDLLRPRFLLGVLRQRVLVAQARRRGRLVGVRVAPKIRPLLVPPDDRVGRSLREGFEQAERDLVMRLLTPGDSFVDIGAHVGLYTVLAAHRVGVTGEVFAAEPHPESFAVLQQNVQRHKIEQIVRPLQVAVSDENGFAKLNIPQHSQAAWSSLGEPWAVSQRSVDVETVTVDWLLQAVCPFLMKIDVEGWERRVLAGGVHKFSSSDAPHLLIELSEIASARALCQLGYALYSYDSRRVALDPVSLDEFKQANLVASKCVEELRRRLSA